MLMRKDLSRLVGTSVHLLPIEIELSEAQSRFLRVALEALDRVAQLGAFHKNLDDGRYGAASLVDQFAADRAHAGTRAEVQDEAVHALEALERTGITLKVKVGHSPSVTPITVQPLAYTPADGAVTAERGR